MMKYLLVLAFGILVVACGQQSETSTTTTPSGNPTDSELTLYMRHLEKQAQDWRENVNNDSAVAWQPEMLDSMFTATPTDGKISDPELFDNLGEAFKKEVLDLSTAPPQDLTTHFNLVVTACVNCHRNFCPGPIKRIQKLTL